jgi:hypothetical protein
VSSWRLGVPSLVVSVLSPVKVTLQKSEKERPFVVRLDKVKMYDGETPTSWIKSNEPTEKNSLFYQEESVKAAGQPSMLVSTDDSESTAELLVEENWDSMPDSSAEACDELNSGLESLPRLDVVDPVPLTRPGKYRV